MMKVFLTVCVYYFLLLLRYGRNGCYSYSSHTLCTLQYTIRVGTGRYERASD